MRIKFIEIQNFRRLKSIRIDLADDKTLFVGANNSGKTTAIVALRRFLIEQKRFDVHDFTLSSWGQINKIGQDWENSGTALLNLVEWEGTLPVMDVWLEVQQNEIHYVQHLLPTLDWREGLLGVRLRLEPKELMLLHKEYVSIRKHTLSIVAAAKENKQNHDYKVPLWPTSMKDFLERGFSNKFCIRSYILDPNKLIDLKSGIARPQMLPPDAEFIETNPFAGLIRIDEINAQRGLADAGNADDISHAGPEERAGRSDKRKLSVQLRSYYSKHLDPSEMPELSDVDALKAIHEAQMLFDEKLEICFSKALDEIQNLGYPGINDPILKISTRIKPMDGLNHPSSLQYDIISQREGSHEIPLRLPEQYNGLGYQNLISMVFRLMSFRDEWMQVGNIGKGISAKTDETSFPPLHLVFIEEPEAHLHVQVQQVFIRKAYEILRNHQDLKDNKTLTTQLVVSTHSSHIAHECEFECLRYFRRKLAINSGDVPTSIVVNLSEVFGAQDDTAKFVTRYLKAAHCDLFFADAAIFIEGAAERMLIPHFIRENFPRLNQSYVTLLEVGGSHAHCFRPLIECLGLNTLIITDIDAAEKKGKIVVSKPIARQSGQITRNSTLKSWIPQKKSIDALLDMPILDKIKQYEDETFSVRVAYQTPIRLILNDIEGEIEIIGNTFEDAFVYENLELFNTLAAGGGLINKFKKSLDQYKTPIELNEAMFKALKSGDKAELALKLLFQKEPKYFNVPIYIREGLEWLQEQISKKEKVSSNVEQTSKQKSPQEEVA